MKKVLFIDRDGTLVIEPPIDYQLDSLEKLEFYPKVFQFLGKIVQELDYQLVMVTNQDGLGTDSFPENTFWPAHNKMLKAFENEGIVFDEILIDRSFPEDMAPTRKPRTGLLTHYMQGDYDLAHSFVLGDRLSDIELAKNLGARGIYLSDSDTGLDSAGLKACCSLVSTDWQEIYQFLKSQQQRSASIHRKTYETDINIELHLDGDGQYQNQTGIGFFDHMLDQLAKHSGINLKTTVKGDLHIDAHHSIEDAALALGQAFKEALGDKRGIERYGHFTLPMDDCLAQVAIDFGGRPWLVWDTSFRREKIGSFPTELFDHFFKSFADSALCNIYIKAEGNNEHHKIEAIFKAFAKAIKMAKYRQKGNFSIASTKGII